jgi:ribosomal protein L37AE/L43A
VGETLRILVLLIAVTILAREVGKKPLCPKCGEANKVALERSMWVCGKCGGLF